MVQTLGLGRTLPQTAVMFAFIGIIVGVLCTMLGYILHGGDIGILIQPTEFIIIFGAGLGIFLGSFGLKTFQASIKASIGLLKAPPSKEQYVDLLKMEYQLFSVARKEGLLGLEKHIEDPEKSDIISKFPSFLGNHHAVHFFCDTLKVILTGAVGPHDLSEMMELDLETAHEEEHRPVEALQTVADAMPAVGIVAAVLGVIITMGQDRRGAVGDWSLSCGGVGWDVFGDFCGVRHLGPAQQIGFKQDCGGRDVHECDPTFVV